VANGEQGKPIRFNSFLEAIRGPGGRRAATARKKGSGLNGSAAKVSGIGW